MRRVLCSIHYVFLSPYWKEHIHEVLKKISRSLGQIKCAKRFLPLESLKNLYTGLVDPHFRYCCAVWGVCGLAEIQQLQKLQNHAAGIITGSNDDAPSKPLLNDLGWKTIEDLMQYESQIIGFKSRNGFGHRLLKYCHRPKLPKKISSSGRKGFSYKGAKMWNSLITESKLQSLPKVLGTPIN